MSLYYIDTSAALKLLAEESHSRAFAEFYDKSAGASWVSSALLRIQVIRAVGRVMPTARPDARALLLAFGYVSVDDEVVPDLDGLATYDDRLAGAAKDAGIPVTDPRG